MRCDARETYQSCEIPKIKIVINVFSFLYCLSFKISSNLDRHLGIFSDMSRSLSRRHIIPYKLLVLISLAADDT